MFPGLTQGLRRAAQMKGAKLAVSSQQFNFTWDQSIDRISRLAAGLRQLGLRQNQRIVYLAYNDHRSLETFYATIWAGGIIVPLNYRLGVDELKVLISEIDPQILIVGEEFTDIAGQLEVPNVVPILEKETEQRVHYEALIQEYPPIPDEGRCGDDVACLFFTGGTTGSPKAVKLSHNSIMANTVNFIAGTGMDEHTTHLHCGPLYHVAAAVRLFSVTHACGRHVMLQKFEPEHVISIIDQERVTLATFVPTMLLAVLEENRLMSSNLDSLRLITYGAAPMPEALLRKAMSELPNVLFTQSYGMTETGPIATMLGVEEHSDSTGRKLRSAGRPALLTEVAIVDQRGEQLPTNQTGEIVVKGPNVMLGYWNNDGATSRVLQNNWMHTGDVGYFDEEGYLYVVDRIKDVIISGGENIYSHEIEHVVAEMPEVRNCAVIGLPDDRWGEVVHVVVVPKEKDARVSERCVIDYCKSRLAGFQCPKSVSIRHDPLPLSAANKVSKLQLRKEVMDTLGKGLN